MAKKDAYYFSHDSNARNDPKVVKLRLNMGWEGYGMYWALLEICKDNNTGDHPWTLEAESLNQLVMMLLNIDKNKATTLIATLKTSGLFTEEKGRFFSKSFVERMVIQDEKRRKSVENGKLGGRPKGKPVGFNQDNLQGNQSGTIIKESKGKKRKVFKAPTLKDVEEYRTTKCYRVEAKAFFDYYSASGWKNRDGSSVKSWKQTFVSWENRDKKTRPPEHKPPEMSQAEVDRIEEQAELDRIESEKRDATNTAATPEALRAIDDIFSNHMDA